MNGLTLFRVGLACSCIGWLLSLLINNTTLLIVNSLALIGYALLDHMIRREP